MKHKRVEEGGSAFSLARKRRVYEDCSDSSLLMCLALSESTLFENLQLNMAGVVAQAVRIAD